MNYQFTSDVNFAEEQEEFVREKINLHNGYNAVKCLKEGFPDIEVYYKNQLIKYLEVKAQRRTFMSVQRILKNSSLSPSETVALNLSDLLRYFKIEESTKIETSIVWVLMNRPCVVPQGEKHFFSFLG